MLAPVVFFSYVPATGRSALFFDRYMIPVIPAFLVVVCVGCAAIAGWAGRARLLVFVVLIAGLYAVELRVDLDRRGGSAALHLAGVTAAVERAAPGSVLFSTTGSAQTGNPAGSFSYGRPATLLDRYLSLRIPSLALANDDDCILLRPFLRAPPVHGMWLFYAALPDQNAAAAATFAKLPGMVVTQPEPELLPRSHHERPAAATLLLREGIALRKRWEQAVPANKRAKEMIEADEAALAHPAACVPQGPLGDPDISPDWPLHKGS